MTRTFLALGLLTLTTPLAFAIDNSQLCEAFARAQLAKAGLTPAQAQPSSQYDPSSNFCTVRITKKGQTEAQSAVIRTNQYDPSSTRILNPMPAITMEWGESPQNMPKPILCDDTQTTPEGKILCTPTKTLNSGLLTPYFTQPK